MSLLLQPYPDKLSRQNYSEECRPDTPAMNVPLSATQMNVFNQMNPIHQINQMGEVY